MVSDGDRGCVGLELLVEGVLWLDWFGIVRLLASCEWSRRIFASDIGTCGHDRSVVEVVVVDVVVVVVVGVDIVDVAVVGWGWADDMVDGN